MARRLPKFPLEMANGAKVRNIEDLRANADIDSIVKYFLSGQLSLWCRVFGYNGIPSELDGLSFELIKGIYEKMDIPCNEAEIVAYLQENHGFSVENTAVIDDAEEESVADNQEIKRKLAGYVDADIQLADYSIEITPVNDDNGKTIKYRVTIENKKAEQYTRFVLPYDVKGGYTKNHFEDDLYKKIANTLKKQQDMFSYNGMKNSRYAGLKKGDTFEFGVYEGKPITWYVLQNDGERLVSISDKTICRMRYGNGKEVKWENSEVKEWLNNEFYDTSFTPSEKEFISKVTIDQCDSFFFVLDSGEICFYFKSDKERMSKDKEMYWLRTTGTSSYGMLYVSDTGYVCDALHASRSLNIRPAFWLKY